MKLIYFRIEVNYISFNLACNQLISTRFYEYHQILLEPLTFKPFTYLHQQPPCLLPLPSANVLTV